MNEKTTYYYYIYDHLETVEDAIAFETNYGDYDLEIVAQRAAEGQWYGHSDSKWMQNGVEELVLLDSEKKEIGRFRIFFESIPTFSAQEIKEEK